METIVDGGQYLKVIILLLVLYPCSVGSVQIIGSAQIIFGPLSSNKQLNRSSAVVIGKPLNISCTAQNIGGIDDNDTVTDIRIRLFRKLNSKETVMARWKGKWTYEYTGSLYTEGTQSADTTRMTASKLAAEWADVGIGTYCCEIKYEYTNPSAGVAIGGGVKEFCQSPDNVFVECKEAVDCGAYGACGKDNLCGCQHGHSKAELVQTIVSHRENLKCYHLCTGIDCPAQCHLIDVQVRYEGKSCKADGFMADEVPNGGEKITGTAYIALSVIVVVFIC